MASSSSKKNRAQRDTTRVRAYLASLPPEVRRAVRNLQAAIRAAVPGAEEGMSWGMPTFRLHGRTVVYYAGWQRHTSLYPMTARIRRAHAAALKGYRTSKGTVQFPLGRPLPTGLVKRLVRARIAELRTRKK
jgi:uncharacterized protein YdhG (YjbR/CyaY superfamily)